MQDQLSQLPLSFASSPAQDVQQRVGSLLGILILCVQHDQATMGSQSKTALNMMKL
jgi:hypothetical protein